MEIKKKIVHFENHAEILYRFSTESVTEVKILILSCVCLFTYTYIYTYVFESMINAFEYVSWFIFKCLQIVALSPLGVNICVCVCVCVCGGVKRWYCHTVKYNYKLLYKYDKLLMKNASLRPTGSKLLDLYKTGTAAWRTIMTSFYDKF